MRILALECSTNTVGLAILDEDRVVGELNLDLGRHHAEVLLPALGSLFSVTGQRWEEIELLACTVGPGSFTGLRIGISTVKGLALAIDRPIVGVSTLEALAQNAVPCAEWICPMIDARKSQIYSGLYRIGSDGFLQPSGEQRLISADDLLREMPPGKILFLGDGALCHKALITQTLGTRATVCDTGTQRIMASSVGRLGLRRYRQGVYDDPLSLTPCYLQLSSAEAKGREAGESRPG